MHRVSRLLAALLVCVTGLAPALHAEGADDRLCTPVPAHAGERTLDAGATADAQHCDVCHWLRSLRAFDAGVDVLAAGDALIAEFVAADPRAGDPPPVSTCTSRAPPRA